MSKRVVLTIIAACGLASLGNCKDKPVRLPPTTSGLIKLIDADQGNDPDLGYRLLMEQDGPLGRSKLRREDELADLDLQLAVDRWAHRSSGMALKFSLTQWDRAKAASRQPISQDEIAWLLDLMGNGKFLSKSAKEWEAETKMSLPYRFRFSSPTSILTHRDLESQRLINAALNSDLPSVRAGAVEILTGRVKWKKSVDPTAFEDQMVKLSTDSDQRVRLATADALGALQTDVPQRALSVLHRLSQEDDLAIVETAIRSMRTFAADVTADQSADVLRATMRLSGNSGGQAVSTLEEVAQKAGKTVCDRLIDVGTALWNSIGNGDSKVIRVISHAARGSSHEQRSSVAQVLCEAIQVSDGYDEMAAITTVGALAEQLSPSSRHAIMEQLIQVIEGPLKDRKVRISQTAAAAAQIAPFCESSERNQYLARLSAILHQPARSQAAARVLGSLGSEAKEAVSGLQQLTQSKDGFIRVASARAIWKIKPDAKLCGDTYIDVMRSTTDYPRRAAKEGLIEMGTAALVVGDEMVELLKHKRCYFLIENVFEKLGPAAAGLTEQVTPLLKHKDPKTRSAAEKVLASITPPSQ